MANALLVWDVARATRSNVILRIEDHDRQRCRSQYETALLDDLEAMGFVPDEPAMDELRVGHPSSHRQSDNGAVYEAVMAQLDALGLMYACDCRRSTFTTWAETHGQPWFGVGCPGGCAGRELPINGDGLIWRVELGEGEEAWTDLILGLVSGPVAPEGDLAIRDRYRNWTYAFSVVVDDFRHGIDLVIRGEDLLGSTPAQIRLARLLGRRTTPRFLHHPLIRRPDGRKLSKADGATSVRDLLVSGRTPSEIRALAAGAVGLRRQIEPSPGASEGGSVRS